ncbi:hypothetical protein GU243_08675 [Pseudarthrobacter psychrotolerans]|uniref:Uncharacterized protein n=1 Tax=Pseudarthrobacter psychrotolerans TaxID=2697569 RepID=A0A6P1NL70_9MICC|nr:DUF6278 family protein [Pseudarthrobacter psychrotolerans]QHK19793.1 hypothetical protein GU243_08675 [Pseudarthrobacter psychrotolerans]
MSKSLPVTNVGGYEKLLEFCQEKGLVLPRNRQGLAVIDSLIEQATDRTSMATLIRPIGMFYGDVLTHTLPGAHWKVIKEDLPEVSILKKTSVSVVHVAQRMLTVGVPTLVMNYDHALDLINREPLQDR